ncbi:MAG: YiiD C-terminal domain-containing protein [Candidatus Thiodiazotropha sp.]
MDITDIAFVRQTGVQIDGDGNLSLDCNETNWNHLQALHAGALFTLAESASALALLNGFAELAEQVLPVVRESQIKYRAPAATRVTAYANIPQQAVVDFNTRFKNKRRAVIPVAVTLVDSAQVTIATGLFKWFVQALD